MLPLIGVLIVIIGFIFKIDTIFMVILAGITTGLIAGIDFFKVLTLIGQSYVDNRMVSLFAITLPVIGILERHGLRQRAVQLIHKLKHLSVGGVGVIYLAIRFIAGICSIRLGGHPQFVRPIVQPMAKAAFVNKYGEPDQEDEDKIKAISAASENYGNFFGQNLFAGAAGVLLIVSTLASLKYEVSAIKITLASIIIAVACFIVAIIQFKIYDAKFAKKYKKIDQKGDK